jgi:hypothetical protein
LGQKEGFELKIVFLPGGRDEAVGVIRPVPHLLKGILHPKFDHLRSVCPTAGEACPEFGLAWRHDKKINKCVDDLRVGTRTDLLGSLHINVHDHIGSSREMVQHFGDQAAVEIPVDFGVLQKFAFVDSVFKIPSIEKVIMNTILFPVAWRAGGTGDGVVGFSFVGQPSAKGGFSGT